MSHVPTDGPAKPHIADACLNTKLEQILNCVENIRSRLDGLHKDFYTVDEVAQMTGRSAYTVRRWINEKRIHATRIEGTGPKGRLLVSRDQVDRLVAIGFGSELPDAAAIRM